MKTHRSGRAVKVCLAVLGAAWLAGCGGGGGSAGGGATASSPVKVTVQWGARSRAVSGPSSALSAVLTLATASPEGTDFVWTINRDSAPAAYTKDYTSTLPAKVGSWTLIARFYSLADGKGDVVASGTAAVPINSDGSGIGILATAGTIASVAVTPGQTIQAGDTTDLAVTARDAQSKLIVLAPGAVFLQQIAGEDKVQITPTHSLKALKPGTASIKAIVDGILSPAQTVTVTSNAVVTITPSPASTTRGGTQQFQASVTSATDTSVTWSVLEGAAGGSISASGLYTAPSTAGSYHVVATSNYDSTKSATAAVTVTAGGSGGGGGIGISISPAAYTMSVGAAKSFSANVTGTSNTAVTWSVQEIQGGSISANGTYTAPGTAGTYHVIATSQADPSVTATAVVTVQSGGSSVVIR